MTELQLGLIGLGAVAVVGVAAYNKWQERRHRKLAEQVLNVQHTDVLFADPESMLSSSGNEVEAPAFDSSGQQYSDHALENAVFSEKEAEPPLMPSLLPENLIERIEPVLHFDPERSEPGIARQEPVLEPIPTMSSPLTELPSAINVSVSERIDQSAPHQTQPDRAFEPVSQARPIQPLPAGEAVSSCLPAESREHRESGAAHLLSPLIDFVAAFETVEPVSAYQILESQRTVLARLRKPVHWIAYNELTQEWEVLVDDGRSEYRRFRAGLQLVDRQGALSDSELSAFHIAMQDLADEFMAIVEMPPRQPALEAAVQLDEFCASVDIQIGINVISQGQVFPGTKLRALAEAAGMVIDAEGRFVRCDDDGNVLYIMLNQEASGFSVETMKTMTTHGVTFLLDVPRVAHGERVFNQMVDLAKRFSDVLRGALVDDNRRPLSEGALEPIRRQVGQYQSMLAARKLPAGGPLARRLFS